MYVYTYIYIYIIFTCSHCSAMNIHRRGFPIQPTIQGSPRKFEEKRLYDPIPGERLSTSYVGFLHSQNFTFWYQKKRLVWMYCISGFNLMAIFLWYRHVIFFSRGYITNNHILSSGSCIRNCWDFPSWCFFPQLWQPTFAKGNFQSQGVYPTHHPHDIWDGNHPNISGQFIATFPAEVTPNGGET